MGMGTDTDWFIAKKSDAARIAAVVTDDKGDFEDWPHLHLPLGQMDFDALWTAMKKPKGDPSSAGKLLFRTKDEDLFVFEVSEQFVRQLGALPESAYPGIAQRWSKDEFNGGLSAKALQALVKLMCAFAKKASSKKLPVIQLAAI